MTDEETDPTNSEGPDLAVADETDPDIAEMDDQAKDEEKSRASVEESRANAKGRIDLMLEEYRTLRTEASARISSRFTLTAVLAGAIALLWGKDTPEQWPLLMAASGVVLLAVWGYSSWLLSRIRTHLKHLEEEISKEAKGIYGGEKNVLTWETSGH